ncbi:hypothetical protein PsYK624_170140 [Phanerochaete sordida]|uniref:Uncharacterized protein n=1 Tax=Phanerochaete sordida TaxID=48140 RepID=A0A9P3GRU8_9APHY|nr:hypothetical protein PsYK624_170140 [Phanerochaete sordida]
MTPKAFQSLLLSLPNELLLLIHDSIEPWDLLAHVCYHQLHARTRACYAKAYMTDFWQNLIFYNGLRITWRDVEPTETVWREAALRYAKHAWTCAQPACGRERLATNRHLMQRALATWDSDDWDGTFILDSREAAFSGDIESSDIFRYINFNNSFPGHDLDEDTRSMLTGECAFLRADPEIDEGWRMTDLLANHPIALDSFATFPPISWLRIFQDFIEGEDADVETTNDEGVTVGEALTSLATLLDKGLTQDKISTLVCFGPWVDLPDVDDSAPFPSSWSQQDAVRAAHRVGHWFQITRWTGFTFECFDETGMIAFIKCEDKQLPDNVRTHIAKYSYPRTD